jgi:hypothetical protein
MQIRETGDRITLIRVAPDPTGRYKRQEVIGTFRRDGNSVPKNLLANLTADERLRLKQWLTVDASRQSLAAHRETFSKVGSQIDALVAALDEAAEFLNPTEADALWQRLAQVSRALKRAGFEKPKRATKPISASPKQIDLLDGQ